VKLACWLCCIGHINICCYTWPQWQSYLQQSISLATQCPQDHQHTSRLSCHGILHRKAPSKLRISAHDLNIERGRYANIPRPERFCCKCQVLEDEVHFLDSCSFIQRCAIYFYTDFKVLKQNEESQ
jgi:hypothetical protein